MSETPSSVITPGSDRHGRRCAFKRLAPEHASREDLALRLEHEGDVLAALVREPGILQLFDRVVDPTTNALTLVLELADDSLDRKLALGDVNAERARRWSATLLKALATCHSHHIIHRDVKPSNILFVGEDLRLADFGVAAWGRPPRALPDGWEEDAVGTPPWSAPELRQNPQAGTAPANDVYGAAMVIRVLLGGSPMPEALVAALAHDPRQRPTIGELARCFN